MDVTPQMWSRWLAVMQQELGVQASNLMLRDLRIAELQEENALLRQQVEQLTNEVRGS